MNKTVSPANQKKKKTPSCAEDTSTEEESKADIYTAMFEVTVKSGMKAFGHSDTVNQLFNQTTLRQPQCCQHTLEMPAHPKRFILMPVGIYMKEKRKYLKADGNTIHQNP